MYCESCGSFIPDGQAFCSNCGAPAPQAATQPEVQPAAQQFEQPAPQAVPVQPVPVQPAYQQPVYQQPVQPMYQQPVYAQPVVATTASQAPVKRSNGSAVVGMVFGILTLLLAWIPVFNILTTALFGLMGLIFSIVGVAKKNAKGKPLAIAGLVTSIIAIVFTILYYVFVGQAIASDPELSQEFEEIFEFEDISYTYDGSEDFITDGQFVNYDNGYASGVLHIDGFVVEF